MHPLGIYIHWPFCTSKCPYCDFNSHVREKIDESQWQNALLKELEFYYSYASSHRVRSIFFGGGTPSLMSPKTVEKLIDLIIKNFDVEKDIEITLEANPNSIETQKFKEFKKAGINRVSIGVQSLREEELKFLGRLHSASEAKQALAIASSIFDNFSFDLIYARPHQTPEAWEKELREGLSFKSPHLSLYQLTIEPNTAFATRYARGDFHLPDEETSAILYEMTSKIVSEFGLAPYEVSNYAKPGFESKHNTLYWEYEDYIGIGPGAHGRLTHKGKKTAFKNYRAPETWITEVSMKGQGVQESVELSVQEIIDECLLMGLRLNKGFPEQRLQNIAQIGFKDVLNQKSLEWLVHEGFVEMILGHLTVTSKGQICLDTILKTLLTL